MCQTDTKFSYRQKVEIVDGFYRGYYGYVFSHFGDEYGVDFEYMTKWFKHNQLVSDNRSWLGRLFCLKNS